MEERYCQSCMMPLGADQADYGTERDGSLSEDYCRYCWQSGEFTWDVTMEEAIEHSVPFVVEACHVTEEEARAHMKEAFPMLKRWKDGPAKI